MQRRYVWRDFEGVERCCVFDLLEADLEASRREFGADPRDFGTQEYRVERPVTFEYGDSPEVQARKRAEAQEALQREIEQQVRAHRERLAARGFRVVAESTMTVDLAQVFSRNTGRMRRYAEQLARATGTARLTVSTALSFIQEMPYRVPPDRIGGRQIGGFLPPVECLAEGYGDCDTKAVLFASLVDDGAGLEVVVFRGPEHVVAGVECLGPAEGVVLQAFGKRFLAAECSGGVWPLGELDDSVRRDVDAGHYTALRLRGAAT